MKKNLVLGLLLFVFIPFGMRPAAAQITVTLPRIPKITRDKPKADQPAQQTQQTAGTVQKGQQTQEESPAAQTRDCSSDPVMSVFLKDIEDTRKQAEEFRPGLRDYYVSTRSDGQNKYLESALSKTMRDRWFSEWKENAYQLRDCLSPALDNLAAVARKTLPGYTGPAGYTLGTPAEKRLILSAVTDISNAKVIKVGIKQPSWLIEKDGYNLPISRYRHGVIYAQYPNDVVGYCWIFWVNLVQDYSGGGTYGASYGRFISRAVAGCPA